MTDFLQLTFSGLTTGAAYALVALGFAIVFRGTRAINFAQGEYVMLAGVLAGRSTNGRTRRWRSSWSRSC